MTNMLVSMWEIGILAHCLLEMQNGVAIVGNILMVPQRVKYIIMKL